MKDYEIETIELIRSIPNNLLNDYNDKVIREMYRRYSQELCAGWLCCDHSRAVDFIEWATTSPLQSYLREKEYD